MPLFIDGGVSCSRNKLHFTGHTGAKEYSHFVSDKVFHQWHGDLALINREQCVDLIEHIA